MSVTGRVPGFDGGLLASAGSGQETGAGDPSSQQHCVVEDDVTDYFAADDVAEETGILWQKINRGFDEC